MKIVKLISSTLLICLFCGISSCSKSYTCECELLGGTTSETWDEIRKSDAKDSCAVANEHAQSFEGSCQLQ